MFYYHIVSDRTRLLAWGPFLAMVIGSFAYWAVAVRGVMSEGVPSRLTGSDSTTAQTWMANYQQISASGDVLAEVSLSEHRLPVGLVTVTLPVALQEWINSQTSAIDNRSPNFNEISVSTLLIRGANSVVGQVDEFSFREGGFSHLLVTRFGGASDLVYDPPLRYPTNETSETSWEESGDIVGLGSYTLRVKAVEPTSREHELEGQVGCKYFEVLLDRDFHSVGVQTTNTVDSYCSDSLPVSSRDLVSGNVLKRLPPKEYQRTSTRVAATTSDVTSLGFIGKTVPAWPMQVKFEPAVDKSQTYVFDSISRRLVAYGILDGLVKWSLAISPQIVGLCGVPDGVVLATLDRQVIAVSALGELRWARSMGDVVFAPCGNFAFESFSVATVDGSITSLSSVDGTLEATATLGFSPTTVVRLESQGKWRVFALGVGGLVSVADDRSITITSECPADANLFKWSSSALVCLKSSGAQVFDLSGETIERFAPPETDLIRSALPAQPIGSMSVQIIDGELCASYSSFTQTCEKDHAYLLIEFRGEPGRETQLWKLGLGSHLLSVGQRLLVAVNSAGEIWRFGSP